jgi:uncharacterized LabA/DUF88 family protein
VPERVGVYIDGFNLYYGVRAATGRRFLWLDVEKLARELLRPHQTLERVTYFTSRVRTPAASHLRQTAYPEALQASTRVEVVEGFLQQTTRVCPACGATTARVEEKKTDVHIACRMLDDAHRGKTDVAVLVSADSDLAPVVGLIRALPRRRVLVVFPPRRYSTELVAVAQGAVKFLSTAMLRRSQLPDPVLTADGQRFNRPAYWR